MWPPLGDKTLVIIITRQWHRRGLQNNKMTQWLLWWGRKNVITMHVSYKRAGCKEAFYCTIFNCPQKPWLWKVFVCFYLLFIYLFYCYFFVCFYHKASFKDRLQLMKKQLLTIRKWHGMNNVYLNLLLLWKPCWPAIVDSPAKVSRYT